MTLSTYIYKIHYHISLRFNSLLHLYQALCRIMTSRYSDYGQPEISICFGYEWTVLQVFRFFKFIAHSNHVEMLIIILRLNFNDGTHTRIARTENTFDLRTFDRADRNDEEIVHFCEEKRNVCVFAFKRFFTITNRTNKMLILFAILFFICLSIGFFV